LAGIKRAKIDITNDVRRIAYKKTTAMESNKPTNARNMQ